jgi:hypothetical protein
MIKKLLYVLCAVSCISASTLQATYRNDMAIITYDDMLETGASHELGQYALTSLFVAVQEIFEDKCVCGEHGKLASLVRKIFLKRELGSKEICMTHLFHSRFITALDLYQIVNKELTPEAVVALFLRTIKAFEKDLAFVRQEAARYTIQKS